MHSLSARSFAVLGTAILLLTPSSFAFDSPLSDTAVREAYFLGQRRDETMARALDKYTKHLPVPKSGPQIASVTFLTPFANIVQSSYEHTMGYSAQQAAIDHRKGKESVKVIVQIVLTDSYPAVIVRPTGADSGSSLGYMLRPYDFWKNIAVQVFNSDRADAQVLEPFTSSGEPTYFCGADYSCALSGATMYFEFPAAAFSSGSAIVQIDPPEGERVSAHFDLSTLR